MAARAKPKAATPATTNPVEEVGIDFDDPIWRRDLEMERLLVQEKMEFDYVKVDAEHYRLHFARSKDLIGQEQIRSQGADQAIVDSYKESFLLGEKMPTGTVNNQLMPVDLYHRAMAALEAGILYFILIRITTEIAPWQRQILATLRNNMHGQRMTHPDTMQNALIGVQHGWTPEETARKFRIDVSALRRAMAIQETEAKATKLGVETKFTTLRRTTKAELANSNLHDPVFKGVVTLLSENPVNTAKAADIIRDVKGQASDRKALDRIKVIREDLAPKTLPTVGGTTTATPSVPAASNGTVTLKSASKAFLDAHAPYKAVLLDAPTVSALLTAAPTDAVYPRIKKVLEEMRETTEKLQAHFV